jgi:mannosyl-oligosaccharide alpha-1,2-mannosidase
MTLLAWNAYKTYAWGKNELKPLNKSGTGTFTLDEGSGLTLVDSMDTLYIMGLYDEYHLAKDWIKHSFNLNIVYISLIIWLFYKCGL